MSGCANAPTRVAWQIGTIDALLDGNYDGQVTFAELRRHGDFGLGTFHELDGEMLALRGRFYQIRSDGRVYPVPPHARTPFSVVTSFRADSRSTLTTELTYAQLQRRLDALRSSNGRAFAVAVRGRFASVRTRSVPRQAKPYPPLVEVVKTQDVFELGECTGTLVGFWFPESLRHLNVPGYHFHFLTDDAKAGGHVLDLTMLNGSVSIQEITTLQVALPLRAPTSRQAIDPSRMLELKKVEK